MEQENKRETMIMSRGWAQDFLWASRARRLSLSLSRPDSTPFRVRPSVRPLIGTNAEKEQSPFPGIQRPETKYKFQSLQ